MRSRSIGLLGRLLAAAVCALAGHIALYGTVHPADGRHAYLSWYQPLVAGLSVTAVVGLAGLVLLGLLRRNFRLPRLAADRSFEQSTIRLAMSGLVFLLVQESIEHSVADRSLSLVSVAEGRWLAVVAVVTLGAAALAFLARLGERAVRALFAETPRRGRRLVIQAWSSAPGEPRRPRPLTRHAALRAPPALSPA